MSEKHEAQLQGQLNDLNELFDQLNYLESEGANEQALTRARNKLESAANQIDMKQAQVKLKEARVLLEAQERVLQEKGGESK